MTESEAIKLGNKLYANITSNANNIIKTNDYIEFVRMAINALEKQEKIMEIIANANQWSKEDIVVKAQAYCDIEKILRSDEE